jgi:surfeit locus 1 family protein
MLRFLARPHWIGLTVATLVVVVVCVLLGRWQLDRLEGRRDANARYAAGIAGPVRPLEGLAASGAHLAYRRAVGTGTFDTAHEVILYGRALDGRAGNHVLTPLVLPDGRAIVVDRGWVPFEIDEPGDERAAPPTGEVEVSGMLFAPQPGGAGEVQPGERRVTTMRSVDVDAIARDVPYELEPWFLQLTTRPPGSGDLPVPAPPPDLSDGPHLSYAFQWFTFAAIAAIGYVVLVRRGWRDERLAVGLSPRRSGRKRDRPDPDP